MTQYLRAYVDRGTNLLSEDGPVVFTASTDLDARDNLVIDQDGWDLDNFRANPVVQWAHDYSRPPIGRAVEVGVTSGRLWAAVEFDRADPFAAEVERKVRQGFLNAVSVGWNTMERQGNRVVRADLLEVSVVPVPADPHALIERQKVGCRALGAELLALAGPETQNTAVPDEPDTVETSKRSGGVGEPDPESEPVVPSGDIALRYVHERLAALSPDLEVTNA